MKIHTSVFVASLLLVPSITALAREPITIPVDTYKAMKKGKKLNRVWQAPGFDGSQGFRLGKLSNESEDEASSVLQDFPIVLQRQMRAGSPYTLHLAVIGVRTSEKPGGASSARVEVEGRVIDQNGTLVAAFETRGTGTMGGITRDNIRFAMNEIAFSIAKDLFSAGLPSDAKATAVIVAASPVNEKPSTDVAVPPADGKSSAIIVAAPASSEKPPMAVAAPPAEVKPSEIIVTAPVIVTPPLTQVVPPEASAPKEAVQPLPVETVPPPVQPPPQVGAPKPNPPAEAPKTPISEALPAAITGNMKRGSALNMLWISPAYDKATGFSLGEVRYLTDQREDAVSGYLPDALAEISKKDAPCILNLGITGLTNRAMIGRSVPIRIKVEGRLIAKDGTVMAAFNTAESVQSSDDLNTSYRQLARKVVLAISKDLR